MDREAWRTTVHWGAKSQTHLKRFGKHAYLCHCEMQWVNTCNLLRAALSLCFENQGWPSPKGAGGGTVPRGWRVPEESLPLLGCFPPVWAVGVHDQVQWQSPPLPPRLPSGSPTHISSLWLKVTSKHTPREDWAPWGPGRRASRDEMLPEVGGHCQLNWDTEGPGSGRSKSPPWDN